MSWWWPFGGEDREEKHINECHEVMREAILYLDRPIVGYRAQAIAEKLKGVILRYELGNN